MTNVTNTIVVPPSLSYLGLPAEMRGRPQWAVAGADKAPLSADLNGKLFNTSVKNSSQWLSFERALELVEQHRDHETTHLDKATGRTINQVGLNIGYILHQDDPFACIDQDVKDATTHPYNPELWTPPEQVELFHSMILHFDSFTERSRSGKGFHIWVKGRIGKGRKRDGVEIYSQERFIISTGNVVHGAAVADRQAMLTNMVLQMGTIGDPDKYVLEELPEDADDWYILQSIDRSHNRDKFWTLWNGKWGELDYPSQSEADMAMMSWIAFHTLSNAQVRRIFRESELGKRQKATKNDYYVNSTLKKIRAGVAAQTDRGREFAESILAAHPLLLTTPSVSGAAPSLNGGFSGPRQLVGRSLANVQARAIEWLWTGWIPKGYVTIFAGETGAGKSTVLADIAARVTTGAPWPGETGEARPPARVLWLGSEDSIEEMTVPRLMACGANLHNVTEIQAVMQEGKRNTFSLQDDLEAVGHWLTSARDEGTPFAMLVIDPVTSYLTGQRLKKVDLNDAGQLRTVLEPWLALAQQYQIAIVCVTHFAKDTQRAMVHRVLGSAAFAQTCRSLCAVVEPPATEDYEPGPHEKALIQVKTNLPDHPGGAWRFSTEKTQVAIDQSSGKAIFATRPNWDHLDSFLTPKTAVGATRGPKSQQAPAFGVWLEMQFPAGRTTPVPVEQIMRKAVPSIVSQNWWDKHSMEFLDKTNVNGTWMCRPKVLPPPV